MKLALTLSAVTLFCVSTTSAADFHVAPKGNDTNAGTEEKPLAALEAARDAARKAGAGPHRIVVMTGDYFLEKTLELDARDNGLTKFENGKLVAGMP